jgi:hypothetical protein
VSVRSSEAIKKKKIKNKTIVSVRSWEAKLLTSLKVSI